MSRSKKHFQKAIISQESNKKSKSRIQYNFCNSAFLSDAFLRDAFKSKCNAFSQFADERDAFKRAAF